MLEREKDLMHEYVKQHFLNVNEEPIYGKFKKPKFTKKKVHYGFFKQHNSDLIGTKELEEYERISKDPCLGPQYLERRYPVFYRVKFKLIN